MNYSTYGTPWQLDPRSRIPLHAQFAARLVAAIRSGAWKAGDRIPSERELMHIARISRATVRQALTALEREGVLERVHGRGTFVKHARFEQPLQSVYSFSQQLQSEGVALQHRLLRRELLPATEAEAALLGVAAGEPLIHLERLRLVHDVPMMINIAQLPYRLCPHLMTDEVETSLYDLLHARYDLPVLRATEHFIATLPSPQIARLLKISTRDPVMRLDRVAYTRNDVVLHLGLNYLRGDMCSFRSDLLAPVPHLELRFPG